jgi:hypothetical protein
VFGKTMMKGLPSTRTASARPSRATRNTIAIFLDSKPSIICNFTPNATAESFNSLNDRALPGWVDLPRTATRESLGSISFKSSSCLALISGARLDNPVMFPPGRARLTTKPQPKDRYPAP